MTDFITSQFKKYKGITAFGLLFSLLATYGSPTAFIALAFPLTMFYLLLEESFQVITSGKEHKFSLLALIKSSMKVPSIFLGLAFVIYMIRGFFLLELDLFIYFLLILVPSVLLNSFFITKFTTNYGNFQMGPKQSALFLPEKNVWLGTLLLLFASFYPSVSLVLVSQEVNILGGSPILEGFYILGIMILQILVLYNGINSSDQFTY